MTPIGSKPLMPAEVNDWFFEKGRYLFQEKWFRGNWWIPAMQIEGLL